MKSFYSKPLKEVYSNFNTNPNGLSEKDALLRSERYGKNELEKEKKRSLFMRFLDQLKDLMIIVLLVAAIVSAVTSIIQKQYTELVDAGIIVLIVLINAIIGLVQENKADKALEALKNMNKSYAKVLRDNLLKKIKVEDIVPGDIVLLEAGDIVPADLRLIESIALKIDEATLTGESVPVEKDDSLMFKDDTPLGDRKNMAYSSSVVTYGRGRGIVVGTGMDTEVGKIAKLLNQDDSSKTPLQIQLAKTAKILSIMVLGIAIVIFIASLINKTSIFDSFMIAVAIAVAAIPEGLPAVVTIVLSIGVKRMSERNAIVKNLPAVETLGCCEVICSDKTGTITLNKMTVKQLYTKSQGLYYNEKIIDSDKSANELVKGLILCNDTVENDNNLVGDPTETALTAYAKKIGIKVKEINQNLPRIAEIPFDSKRKLMSTVHKDGKENIAYIKGAVDMLLNKCKYILDGEVIRPIKEKDIEEISKANSAMATEALRVLALASKANDLNLKSIEQDVVFIGLVGMIDPPREEVKIAVQTCKRAGIKAVMITGDHLDTAVAIAKQIGIFNKGDLAITGAELDKLTEEEFLKNLYRYKVFARVSPENKVRIVKAFKSLKIIVAMTGDGVNDAPSIKIADIGVGMGITGTDVSKGVADMVLADDNFATIVAAVEEGRKVYSNIKKSVQYLLSANIAEVLCLFIATVFLKIPFLSAIMILWVNLVTDSLPALSLGTEKAEKDVMKIPPRKNGSSLFSGRVGVDIFVQGIMQTALVMLSFCLGSYVLTEGVNDHNIAMTMAFITLCLIQLFHAYNVRSTHSSLFSSNPLSNKYLNLSFIVGVLLILFATLIPVIQPFFGTCNIELIDWVISVLCAFAIIPMVEIQKLICYCIKRRKTRKNAVNDLSINTKGK